MSLRVILHSLGWIAGLTGLGMFVPLLFAAVLAEWQAAQAFLVSALTILFISGAIIIASRGKSPRSQRRLSLLLLASVWVLVPLLAAIPFVMSGAIKNHYAAIFEAVSGFTTTGATVITDFDNMAKSMIVWRALLQWCGGLTTYLGLAIILYPFIGAHRVDQELRLISHPDEKLSARLSEAARIIIPLYSSLTLACFIGLFLSGVPQFDAFCLSLSAISTGGFMPNGGTISIYGAPFANLVLTLSMLAGGVSLIWLNGLLHWQWHSINRNIEPFVIILAVFGLGLALGINLLLEMRAALDIKAALNLISQAILIVASIITTTGLAVDKSLQADLPFVGIMVLTLIGGGRFSTAGGIKVFRITAMLRQAGRELKILIYPHGVRPNRFGVEQQDLDLMKFIWASFAVLILVVVLLALVLGGTNLPMPAAFMASISAVSNSGQAYVIAADGQMRGFVGYDALTPAAQLALCLGMILGRVEILALLSLFNLTYWRN